MGASKTPISLRIHPDTLAWFQRNGPGGYQRLINQVLDDYVKEKTQEKSRNVPMAQEIFRQFYAECFWHYAKDLEITEQNMHIVIDGLKKYGGRKGLQLAEELCR